MSTRILIVEDSPTQAAALHALLEGAGYEVRVAASGQEGFRRAEADRFDVVISDVIMPGEIDGYELCRRLKVGRHAQTPVVLLTSLSDPLDIIRGLECGADNFLTKPYQPDRLLERLKTLLGTIATRRHDAVRTGVEVYFMGRKFTITSEREQILDLLMSTFEDAVHQNRELRRHEAELEAAKSELASYAGTLQERLHHVLASTPAVIYSSRVEGTTLSPSWISENVTRATGFSIEDALQPSWWYAHVHPEDQARLLEVLPTCLARGEAIAEYRLQRQDGTYRWVRDHSRLIRDSAGEPSELVGAWVDITDERLLEDQVRMAQKMEAVGTLAGGVAHDFNNILGVIKASADLALREIETGSTACEDLQEIMAAVDRAAALTRQLLAFGRKQMLEPRPLDLSALVAGTVKMIERIMGEDVHLILREASEPITVHADPGQVEQILMNLCVNARDAMPHGGEVVIVTERIIMDESFCTIHPWARPGDYARLTVTDTGSGMDDAVQARIFEPFFTTKQFGLGTGLGLAVVYGIVKQHGGLIHVYSETGKGTVIRVYLPFYEAAPETLAAISYPEISGGTETILLAEDDNVLRTAATKLLKRLGYQVIAVANGEEAVQTVLEQGDAIQLALVDVVMPGIGGRQVFEQVQARYPRLPFIFTTGYNPGTSHTEPLRTLPVEVLSKPYGINSLARAVRRALDGNQREANGFDLKPHEVGEPATTH